MLFRAKKDGADVSSLQAFVELHKEDIPDVRSITDTALIAVIPTINDVTLLEAVWQ